MPRSPPSAGWSSASVSTWEKCGRRTAASTATASTSRRVWRGSPSPAGSASRRRSTARCGTSWISDMRTWESSRSRTSRIPCTCIGSRQGLRRYPASDRGPRGGRWRQRRRCSCWQSLAGCFGSSARGDRQPRKRRPRRRISRPPLPPKTSRCRASAVHRPSPSCPSTT